MHLLGLPCQDHRARARHIVSSLNDNTNVVFNDAVNVHIHAGLGSKSPDPSMSCYASRKPHAGGGDRLCAKESRGVIGDPLVRLKSTCSRVLKLHKLHVKGEFGCATIKLHTRTSIQRTLLEAYLFQSERLTSIRLCHDGRRRSRLPAHHPARRGATAGQAHRTWPWAVKSFSCVTV
jgi:hypothetical protein